MQKIFILFEDTHLTRNFNKVIMLYSMLYVSYAFVVLFKNGDMTNNSKVIWPIACSLYYEKIIERRTTI